MQHPLRQHQIPKEVPRTNNRVGQLIGSLILKAFGWQVTGEFPQSAKFIAAVAPHTSNWDFVIAIAVKFKLGLQVKFLGKHSIFVGPFAYILKRMGGIPVDRRATNGIVNQVTRIFHEQDALILGLAPEGTRKYTQQWKTGFIYMAYSANVPIVPMLIDYRSKTFVILPAMTVTDDVPAELIRIKQQYPKSAAKYPAQVSD